MKITFKKIAAILSAAAVAFTMSGCVDNGYIMTVDGLNIRNGVYLSMQQTSISNAQSKVSENEDDTTSSDDTPTDISEIMVEGKTFSDWVKEDTIKGIKRFVGIMRQCEQYGIELSDDELTEINKTLQEDWNSSDYYLQILGYGSMGEYYESIGIGMDSVREIDIASALNEKLFIHYFGEGGERAVPDEEIDKYMEENNATYKLITLSYLDYYGNPLMTDEEKQEIVDRANGYAERYNNGEQFIDILYDFDLQAARDKARKEAEESYTEDNEGGLTKEEYVQKAIDEATAEKGIADIYYDEVITRDTEYITEALREYIFSAPTDGKATVFEGVTSAYLVIRQPVLALDGWREMNLVDVLKAMKTEDFDSMMDLMSQNYSVEQNDYLVNKKYAPEKMMK